MGHSSWDHQTYRAFSAKASTQTREQTFSSRRMHPDMDPALITIRESRDSEAHPNSNAIIFAFDETGSMGSIPELFVKKCLGDLMRGIFDQKPVTDPHIMVMGIGDAHNGEEAPLQVSQFETDIRIADQLSQIFLEGNGGGNGFESYDLPWYFAASKTVIDCYEKRGRKGYLFTIGDELPPQRTLSSSSRYLIGACGEKSELLRASPQKALEAAQERYHVFHIVVEEGDFAQRRLNDVMGQWKALLGKKVIPLSKAEYIAPVILAVMAVNEGTDPEEAILAAEGEVAQRVVRHALFGGRE